MTRVKQPPEVIEKYKERVRALLARGGFDRRSLASALKYKSVTAIGNILTRNSAPTSDRRDKIDQLYRIHVEGQQDDPGIEMPPSPVETIIDTDAYTLANLDAKARAFVRAGELAVSRFGRYIHPDLTDAVEVVRAFVLGGDASGNTTPETGNDA